MPALLEIFRTVGERLATVPGVRSVSIADSTPYSLAGDNRSVRRAGTRPAPDARPATAAEGLAFSAPFNAVGADYFATVGRPLLRGRAFTRFETDHVGAPPVAIIDEALAALLWPGEEALGRRLEWADRESPGSDVRPKPRPSRSSASRAPRISSSGTRNPPARSTSPSRKGFTGNVFFFLRSANAGETALARLREPVRRELQAAAPDVPFFKVRTFPEHKDASLEPWLLQRISTVATAFGAVAALIAVIGSPGKEC